MNIVERMLEVESGNFANIETEKLEIKRLSKVIGEPFIVECQMVPGRRYQEILRTAQDKNGNLRPDKTYDANLILVTAGVVSPDLKDEKLQKHFGVASPKDLAEKLFNGGEVTKIANAIAKISGFGSGDDDAEDTDEEIKN